MVGAMESILGGLPDCRRLYPDLPGMGRTPASGTLHSADDVLDLLLAFIDGVVGAGQFRLIGHSVGAHYARAIAGRRLEQVTGVDLSVERECSESSCAPGLARVSRSGRDARPGRGERISRLLCRADAGHAGAVQEVRSPRPWVGGRSRPRADRRTPAVQ
ncbi:alpha/beta fold hydrolase [Arthrobacter globiformis]|uniref:alpha/beta fold hydrolase n=1 Tax=Arthrobacter globiformis TaxID=1665 RepID=UPI00358FEEED